MTPIVFVLIVISMTAASPSYKEVETPLPPDYYPFVVAIVYNFSEKHLLRQCTGSVIKPNMVLSNSHCLQRNAGFIEYNLQEKKTEMNKKKRNLKKILKMVIPSRLSPVEYNVGTIGLIFIKPFVPRDHMEILGQPSYTKKYQLGQYLTYAALKQLNLPVGYSGINIPNADVFTGTGIVVKCQGLRGAYACIKENGYEMPGRPGGPVMNGNDIVGVVNLLLKYGDRKFNDTFTFSTLHKHSNFIDIQSTVKKED